MKKLFLIFCLLIASSAFAQSSSYERNDAAASIRQSTNLHTMKRSLTQWGAGYLAAGQTGGCTMYHFSALLGTVQQVKGTVGTICGYFIANADAAACFVQIFDVAAATPVVLGTTVPNNSWPFFTDTEANIPPVAPGIAFANGLKIAATTTDGGLTACGTGMTINIWYK